MWVLEFLIRLAIHENIRYFLSNVRIGKFLSHAMKDKRKDCATKIFNKFKHPHQRNMIWFFTDEKKFCQDQMVNSQNNHCLALTPQHVPIVMKIKHPVQIIKFEVDTSSHIDSDSTRWPTSEPGVNSPSLDWGRASWNTLCRAIWLCTTRHKKGNSLGCEK